MTDIRKSRFQTAVLILFAACLAVICAWAEGQKAAGPAILGLVPEMESWTLADELQSYHPESLFEYINGAAESYLSYDFRELLVAQFEDGDAEATLTVEIYDMGTPLNAFGIFSSERYPDNRAVPVGDLGYVESETLNFLSGKYYVKLLGFGLGEEGETVLRRFGEKVAGKVKSEGSLPKLVRVFPSASLVPRSEKFIKKNFMGYEFLSNGYVATYKIEGQDIESFFVEAGSDTEAESMEGRLLDFLAKDKQVPEKIALGYHVKNRYGQHLYIGRVRNVLFGVMRIPDGLEAAGERMLGELSGALAKDSARMK